jgi:hypothetical protein
MRGNPVASQPVRVLFALVMAGTAAACTSETPEPSDALKAANLSVRAVGSMRDAKGQHMCNVVMLAPDIAATDAHCIKPERQTIRIFKPDGSEATSTFTVLMQSSEAFARAFSTDTPELYKADHAEIAADQAILKLDKPVADAGATMQVAYESVLDWQPLAGTTLQVADVKFAAHNRVRMIRTDEAPRDTDRTRLLLFDCKLIKSKLLDMVVAHTCPSKGGSSGGALYKEGPKGEFMLVALHTGNLSQAPDLTKNPPFNLVAFEYIPFLRHMENGFDLELYDMSGGRELTDRRIKTGVLVTPLADACRLTKNDCKIP